jgi:hypothetical protein
MKIVVLDVKPHGSYKSRPFGRTYRHRHQGEKISELRRTCSMLQLVVTADVVPRSLILFTLMMKAIRSSETLVGTRATRRHIPEDGIFRIHRRENIRYYTVPKIFSVSSCLTAGVSVRLSPGYIPTPKTSITGQSRYQNSAVCMFYGSVQVEGLRCNQTKRLQESEFVLNWNSPEDIMHDCWGRRGRKLLKSWDSPLCCFSYSSITPSFERLHTYPILVRWQEETILWVSKNFLFPLCCGCDEILK